MRPWILARHRPSAWSDRRAPFRSGVHHAVHTVDGFVNLVGVLESNRHRIHGAEIHGEFHRGLAVFRTGEAPLAHELHTDYTQALGMHLLGVSDYFIDVAEHLDIPLL